MVVFLLLCLSANFVIGDRAAEESNSTEDGFFSNEVSIKTTTDSVIRSVPSLIRSGAAPPVEASLSDNFTLPGDDVNKNSNNGDFKRIIPPLYNQVTPSRNLLATNAVSPGDVNVTSVSFSRRPKLSTSGSNLTNDAYNLRSVPSDTKKTVEVKNSNIELKIAKLVGEAIDDIFGMDYPSAGYTTGDNSSTRILERRGENQELEADERSLNGSRNPSSPVLLAEARDDDRNVSGESQPCKNTTQVDVGSSGGDGCSSSSSNSGSKMRKVKIRRTRHRVRHCTPEHHEHCKFSHNPEEEKRKKKKRRHRKHRKKRSGPGKTPKYRD